MNPSRFWLNLEIEEFERSLPRGSLVLDAGAGNQPYKPKFTAHTYESADFEMVDKKYAQSTYVCDLSAIQWRMDASMRSSFLRSWNICRSLKASLSN